MGALVLQSLIFYALGAAIAMAVAGIIWLLVLILSRKAPATKAAAVPLPLPNSLGTPPEHVAAIMAAVAVIVGRPVRILHIEDARSGAWSAEGKLLHQTSHQVPRRPR